ncbi:response regulator [bacterium]|nr:response regulator [bacterium]
MIKRTGQREADKEKAGRKTTEGKTDFKTARKVATLPGTATYLYILKQLMEAEDLEAALRQVSLYNLDLLELRSFGVFFVDRKEKTSKIIVFENEDNNYQFLNGMTYPLGEIEWIDEWISELISSGAKCLKKNEFKKFIIMMANGGVISEESLEAIHRTIIPVKSFEMFWVVGGKKTDDYLAVSIFVPHKTFTEGQEKLIKGISQAINLGVGKWIELDRTKMELSKYKAIVETQAHAFFLIANGRIEFFNRQFPAMLGVSAGRIKGRRLEEFLEPGEREEIKEIVDSCMRNGNQEGRKYFRVFHLAKNSREIELQLNTVDFKGNPALRGSMADLSEKTRIEKSMLEEKHMENIATMAGGVAHDFNNMIGAMIGYSSVVRNSLPEYDRRVKQLDKIEEAGIRARKLTDQLLSISRKGKYRLEIVDVKDILYRVITMSVVPTEHIPFTVENNAELVNIEGDSSQIYEAFLNICMNAKEAMQNGGKIEAKLYNRSIGTNSDIYLNGMKSGKFICIEIRDYGNGMERDVLGKAKMPFFTTKEGSKHRGLGLSAAEGVIENHRGKLEIESYEGKGTKVVIYLPVTEKLTTPTVQFRKDTLTKTLRVLVVDDEEIVCGLAKEMLETKGHRAITALSGKDALNIIKKGKADIDIVILDLIMPGMNGQEVFHELKEIASEIPVIISSGYGEDNVIQQLLKEGAASFLKKPYRLNDFYSALDRVAAEWHKGKSMED